MGGLKLINISKGALGFLIKYQIDDEDQNIL